MIITLNNTQTEFNCEKLSIADIIELKSFTFKMLVVKLNGKLIVKEDFSNTFVTDGDNVMILHLISGG